MDIILDERIKERYRQGVRTGSQFYQELVQQEEDRMRESLVDMGRPLWQRYKILKGDNKRPTRVDWELLTAFAASKLVCGLPLKEVPGKAIECRWGCSSVLSSRYPTAIFVSTCSACCRGFHGCIVVCQPQGRPSRVFICVGTRLGVRGCIFVASTSCEHYFSGSFDASTVEKDASPRSADTGGVSELVARLVLLLTMDATGVVATGAESARAYDGTFYSVETFLRTLSGDSSKVVLEDDEVPTPTVDNLLTHWSSWKVGFSHFVQLSEEPTKEVLWAMLSRRAACAVPRNFPGIDLLIPIFKPSDGVSEGEVSMISVQVKNWEKGDSSYPDSAMIYTRPCLVFEGELNEVAGTDMFRLYMSLRGVPVIEQYFRLDPGKRRSDRLKAQEASKKLATEDDCTVAVSSDATSVKESSASEVSSSSVGVVSSVVAGKEYTVVVCTLGMSSWNVKRGSDDEVKIIEVVPEGVATQLISLLSPWWKLESFVRADLELRGDHFGLPSEDVMQVAMRPTVESVIQHKWQIVTAELPPSLVASRVRSNIDSASLPFIQSSTALGNKRTALGKQKRICRGTDGDKDEEDQDDDEDYSDVEDDDDNDDRVAPEKLRGTSEASTTSQFTTAQLNTKQAAASELMNQPPAKKTKTNSVPTTTMKRANSAKSKNQKPQSKDESNDNEDRRASNAHQQHFLPKPLKQSTTASKRTAPSIAKNQPAAKRVKINPASKSAKKKKASPRSHRQPRATDNGNDDVVASDEDADPPGPCRSPRILEKKTKSGMANT